MAKAGFSALRDLGFAAVLSSTLMLITSHIVQYILYFAYGYVSSEFLAKRKDLREFTGKGVDRGFRGLTRIFLASR